MKLSTTSIKIMSESDGYSHNQQQNTAPHPQMFIRQSDPIPPPINGTLRLVFLSDTHDFFEEIQLPLPAGDVLFHLGDACHKGSLAQLKQFVQWLKKNSLHFKERIVIDGNHDYNRDNISDWRGIDYLAEYEGVARVLKNEVIEAANGKLSILGMTWNACKNEDYSEAKSNIQNFQGEGGDNRKNIDLVLSHSPPYVKGGGHGWEISHALSQFIKEISPPLHCFGHVHFARGIRAYNSLTTMINCASTFREPVVIDYCPVERRALMIHCPLPDESLTRYHFSSRKFPKEWIRNDPMDIGY